MLNTKSSLILKFLQKECKNGGYNIVDKNDIISALPMKYRCDFDELDNIISFLERHDFVSVKYDDENVYCISVLPFNEENFEEKKKKKNTSFLLVFLILIFSFLGSFLGSFISKFI